MKKKIPESEIKKIPKLPRGEGTISLSSRGDKLRYQKNVNGKRVTVYAEKVSDLFKLMREKESSKKKVVMRKKARILEEEMWEYIELVKKPTLKPKSYDRIVTTYNNQIKGTDLGRMRIPAINSAHIQNHLNMLNESGKSYSVIKKTYDLLNPFFKYIDKTLDENPMDDVNMLTKAAVTAKEKQSQFLTDEEIQGFIDNYKRVYKIYKKDGTEIVYPKHYLSAIFTFDIFTGLRIGEIIALRWKDVNFDDNYVNVSKSIEVVRNQEYNPNKTELMKKKGITKYISLEGETKNYSYRSVPLPVQAKDALMFLRKYSKHTDPDDFVAANKYGTINNPSNMNTTLKIVYKEVLKDMLGDEYVESDVKNISMHSLRHTCASLMFRHTDLRVEEIASNLGHSPEVCRKTYIHLVEERKAIGMKQMSEIDFSHLSRKRLYS